MPDIASLCPLCFPLRPSCLNFSIRYLKRIEPPLELSVSLTDGFPETEIRAPLLACALISPVTITETDEPLEADTLPFSAFRSEATSEEPLELSASIDLADPVITPELPLLELASRLVQSISA